MNSPAQTIEALLAKARYQSPGIGTNASLHLELVEGCLILRVSGSSSDTLPDTFTGAVASLFATLKPRQVAVDLGACQSLPSVILAFLVFFQKQAEEHGGAIHGTGQKVVLFSVAPRVRTMIQMIGMQDFFVIQPDQAAMQRWFASMA